jgi:hypothetical protein
VVRGRECYLQHQCRRCEGTFGLHAVPVTTGGTSVVTALGDIPCDGTGMLRIRVVWSRLTIEAERPKRTEDHVCDDAQDWNPNVHDEHRAFHQQEEHGEDGDDDVELGDTV